MAALLCRSQSQCRALDMPACGQGGPYKDLGRLWVCFIDYGGDYAEPVQTTLEGKEEIRIGACRSCGDCAILHRGQFYWWHTLKWL